MSLLTSSSDIQGPQVEIDGRAVTGHSETVTQTQPEPKPSLTHPFLAIPGYEILGELGRGGMGVVYKARHVRLNRPTAIKMLLGGQYANPIAQVRFLVEAEVVAQIQHVHVVRVFEFGQHDGQPFFALEFVEGGTLAGKLKSVTRFAPRDAARMVAKLADAIAAAHAKGIVHRDLKPANVLLDENGQPKVTDFGLAKVGTSEMTLSGAIVGTPSYMSPEQASGRTKEVGTPTDVYALGCILYELLTGRPPFKGESPMETIQQVRTSEPMRPRSVVSAIPRDLETICLKCLEKDVKKRYSTAAELEADLWRYLDGRPITARPVSSLERVGKWASRNPARAIATGVSILVLIATLIAANEVQKQQEADRFAVEKQRADDRIQSEQQRTADLRTTRAESLVRALSTASTSEVPRLIEDLAEMQELARPKLVELARQPILTKPGLHGRLALLSNHPAMSAELVAYLPICQPDELLTIRQLLKPHASLVTPELWVVLLDAKSSSGKRVRAASALADLTPTDSRWESVSSLVVELLVKENSLQAVVWSQALEPVRGHLLPSLIHRYRAGQSHFDHDGVETTTDDLMHGRLTPDELVRRAADFDFTSGLLPRYATDRPGDLAELAMTVEARHYPLFVDAIRNNRDAVVALLKAELGKSVSPDRAKNRDITPALAVVVGASGVADVENLDSVFDILARRQANAAAVLMTLGEAESVWQLLAFPKNGDPTTRGYLIERLAGIGADPKTLMDRFDAEVDVSARRALLIALGEFPLELMPVKERERFLVNLLDLYRNDPDSGVHAAIDWLLRQKWGKANEIASLDAELATSARSYVSARAVFGVVPVVALGQLFPAPRARQDKDWYVNGEGQTYAVVRGPVEFMIGESRSASPKRINRTYSIASKEVTVEQFLRFRKHHQWSKQNSPGPDTPVVNVNWYDCAAYCNWLSEREGIPSDQWCYQPNRDGKYAEGTAMKLGHLSLTGYRLPTDAEWEYSCRAGSVTEWHSGRGQGLSLRYGWSSRNSKSRAWPVSQLRPNERGLFDMSGNAWEWCEDSWDGDAIKHPEDIEATNNLRVEDNTGRQLRGGSFFSMPANLQSTARSANRPVDRLGNFGFRPVRTLPE
ncbi:MAG: SUMF1/EgtB/PvdO family nonheme iron enzyme [Planctomycetes bacterium]|nr:SUMF1/EgtB/PvdO family nonheme iron enzyme [Planctomycetota bacterium]